MIFIKYRWTQNLYGRHITAPQFFTERGVNRQNMYHHPSWLVF